MATAKTAAQAASYAATVTHWAPAGYCANFVWYCLTRGARTYGIEDANEAWTRSTGKVLTGTPPAGAPVHFAGGRHGHIAISLGGGKIRSTDWPNLLRVGTTTIHDIEREWGIVYRGFTRTFAGDPIPGLAAPAPVKPPPAGSIPRPPRYDFSDAVRVDDEALRLGRKSGSAVTYNARAWAWLYYFDNAWARANWSAWSREPANVYGPMSVKVTRRIYAKLYASDHKNWRASDGAAANYPGPALLRRLGLRAD